MARPLNDLLSAALADLGREFERAAGDRSGALSLEIHLNLLRHVPDDGLEVRDIPRLARVSKRAAHWNVAIAERRRWIVVADKRARPTTTGRRVREATERCLEGAEAAWRG